MLARFRQATSRTTTAIPSSIGAIFAMLPSPDGAVLTEKREIGVVVNV
jgi:hypothetical protein